MGFGPSDLHSIAQAFREIVAVVAQDGIVFDATSVRVEEIRKNPGYADARVIVSAELARARCTLGLNLLAGFLMASGTHPRIQTKIHINQ